MEKFYITKTENALDLPLPKYMTDGASGMDLYANVAEPLVIMPGEIKLVPAGIRIALPDGFEAQIRPRSGLALKHGIGLLNSPGTIDSDYRGEIQAIMFNFGKEPFEIKRGDRIAQMVIAKYESICWEETDELPQSVRGNGGFGHTG